MADNKKRSKSSADSNMRIKKAMIRILAVVLLVAGTVAVWQNRVDYCYPRTVAQCTSDNFALIGVGGGFPVSVNGGSFVDIEAMPDGIFALSDVSLTVYDRTALEYEVRTHYMSSPTLEASGRYALLYDLGGKNYRVETEAKTLVEQTTDYVIAAGAVSRTGRYALLSYDSQQLTRVDVYNPDGEEIFKWHSENLYFTDVALSPSGQYIAYCGFNASEGEMKSYVMVQRVKYTDTYALIEYPGEYLISLEFLKGGRLAVIGSDSMLIVDRDFDSWTEIDYAGELESYDITYDSGVALVTYPAKGASEGTLSLYDTTGTLRSSSQVAVSSARVSLSDRCCAVFGRGRLECRGLGGELLGSDDIAPTTQDILTLGKRVFLMEPSYLRQADYSI